MIESTQRFIFKLIRAANEVDRLTIRERANLLRRAAATIRNLREEIACSGTPENGQKSGLVHDLEEMAKRVHAATAADISAALLESVEMIKALRILLDERNIECAP